MPIGPSWPAARRGYGIDPALVAGMKRPVLVRELAPSEGNPRRAIADLNKTGTTRRSPRPSGRRQMHARSRRPPQITSRGQLRPKAGTRR